MPKIIEVPGEGQLSFPDTMGDDEIKSVLKTKFPTPGQRSDQSFGPGSSLAGVQAGTPLEGPDLSLPAIPPGSLEARPQGPSPEQERQAAAIMEKPRFEIMAQLPQSDLDKMSPKERGVFESIRKNVNSLTSLSSLELTLPTLGIGALGPVARRALGVGFGAMLGKHAADVFGKLGEEYAKPPEQRDDQKISELWTDAGIAGSLGTLSAFFGVRPGTPGSELTPRTNEAMTQPTTGAALQMPMGGRPSISMGPESARLPDLGAPGFTRAASTRLPETRIPMEGAPKEVPTLEAKQTFEPSGLETTERKAPPSEAHPLAKQFADRIGREPTQEEMQQLAKGEIELQEKIDRIVEKAQAVKEQEAQRQRTVDFQKAVAEKISQEQEPPLHPEKPLTENQIRIISDSLTDAIEKGQIPGANRGIISGSQLEKWADERISKGSGVNMGADPTLAAAGIVKGASLLERGITEFGRWSKEILKEYGPTIKPYLPDIYKQSIALRASAFTKGKEDASKISQTAEVHGNVRPREESASALPVSESSAGVQPQAKGRVQPSSGSEQGIGFNPARAASGMRMATDVELPESEFGGPTVEESNGGTSPPPVGSAANLSTLPEGADLHQGVMDRYLSALTNWWQEFTPRTYAVLRKAPDSSVITAYQRFLKGPIDYMANFTKQPWFQALRKYSNDELIDLEHQVVTDYRQRVANGEPQESAYESAVSAMPEGFQQILRRRDERMPIENAASDALSVERPNFGDDPYVARLTNREGQNVISLHPSYGNFGRALRETTGSFDKSRTHATMREGIAADTQYEPVMEAVWLREFNSARLEASANMLKELKETGVLWDSKEEAMGHSPTGEVMKLEGLGGKDYWVRSKEEAQFLKQQLESKQWNNAMGQVARLANSYIRNPNLINPLPHITKNMFFKYILARVGNATFRRDVAEFTGAAADELKGRFEKVMPFPETSLRVPEMKAKEIGNFAEKAAHYAQTLNRPSQWFIFSKADPAMRYALWKSYVRKGMSDQEAANNVWIDLIRYDENSGGLNFWRQLPFNYFATWRTGTVSTLWKMVREHPVRTLAAVGAIEYLREARYRATGRWTHLPVDYLEAPLAEAIKDPKALKIAGLAAGFLAFGPGGGQGARMISDLAGIMSGNDDPRQKARLQNMFWGISQIYNMPDEWNAYQKDHSVQHLINLATGMALAEHSSLKYNPDRLMKWLPESLPLMQRSEIVRQAEELQKRIKTKQTKAQGTREQHSKADKSLSAEQKAIVELERAGK